MVPALKKYYSRKTRVIVALFLVVLLALPPVANFVIPLAHAAPLTNYQVLINNSQASATGVTYTFNWTISSALQQIKQIDVLICTTPSGTCNAPSGFSTGTPTLVTDNIAGTGRTVSGSTANDFRIVVTTPAAQSTTTMSMVWSGVTNPSTTNTTYYARATTYSDTGTTILDGSSIAAFAVLTASSIAVSASVDSSFTFSVAGVSSGANFNGGTANVNTTSTATTIPFGTLAVGTEQIAVHDITISTNATNGYQVTASHSATIAGNPPLASGSANIDAFTGTNASPTSWSSPNGTTASVNTGFFGYSTEDSSLCNGTASRFTSSGPKWAGSSITGGEVACSSVPVSSETTRIGWSVEVDAYQPPGLYQGTAILIATPTY